MQPSPVQNSKPLEGVRVLDFTRVLAGPYCTALMADLGADVIKVEALHGDDYRHIGPFDQGESLLFQAINRGKRSIALNLKSDEDIATIKSLLVDTDVLVENFRPGVMEKLGLGVEALSAAFPALVYVSVSGFGQTGTNAAKPAYDIIIQAMSGLMDVTGEPDGTPTMIGEAMGDVAGGLFAAWGTMVALFDRSRTGKGRHVDVALFDALTAMMPLLACRTLMGKDAPTRTGNRHSLSAPFGTYPAGDGHFAVAVLNDRLFETFCKVIEQPELARDPRFVTDPLRRENEPALAEQIALWAGQRSVAEIVASLSAAGIPASEIKSVAQAWASSQAVERGLASAVDHPLLGRLNVPEQPVHFSGAARGDRTAAPGLNANATEILAELAKGETK
ncbi:CoA transferase [Aquicoccus porphyridii]|jgi:CoA:oxalate CoA-transferase|uniref:CoA transferase n=1 Tax=Aquicoccus porphyridii TaxID=1852029 RepID=A0A5A9Z9S5_9RHOB|nr:MULTISPECIES: CoA transferase [Rhodobacterales]KAA0913953.1 CoA transferase [Aquicoccus porphyridii]OAN74957.1 acyl-CoA transferase [Sulfitobacter sp. EhC04]RAI52449.1 CoA transferase [Rhodobacteraceae bacterium AsT-22]